jgi:hypothetical protein
MAKHFFAARQARQTATWLQNNGRMQIAQHISFLQPGVYATKHGVPNFTHVCKIFSQTCVQLLNIKKSILTKFYKYV